MYLYRLWPPYIGEEPATPVCLEEPFGAPRNPVGFAAEISYNPPASPQRQIVAVGVSCISWQVQAVLTSRSRPQAGGAKKVLDFTVEYAKNRVQFGRIIGSFQAIKHMAADLLIETESAISAARHAAASLADQSDRTQEAISLAAFACADAYVKTAADGIQMHGGIAFTWEHPAHLYLRRARSGAQLFGDSDYHRESYLQALGG